MMQSVFSNVKTVKSLMNAFVYSFESIGILLSFPNQSHGLIFSLVELIGAFFNFAQIPVVGAVQKSISAYGLR